MTGLENIRSGVFWVPW